MAVINYTTKTENGNSDKRVITDFNSPGDFVLRNIPDGVPFLCYSNGKEISQDVDAMFCDGEFDLIETTGEAILSPFSSFNDPLGINRKIRDAILPQPEEINQQVVSANNSLTNRTNKPRPYARAYDICGTVQSIPSDLMQSYSVYDNTNRQYSYGYYYVCRGHVAIDPSGVLDGDTLLSTVSGSSANFYKPYETPNNASPYLIIGEQINEPLFIGVRSNSVDGVELKAPNEYELALTETVISCQLVGTIGALVEISGTLRFDDLFTAGQQITLVNVNSGAAVLGGNYTVAAVSGTSISFDVTANLTQWQKIAGGTADMTVNSGALIKPVNLAEAGFTDWVTISTIKPERIVANIVARRGMGRTPAGKSSTQTSSATAELQYQLVDSAGQPFGPINSVSKTLTDKTREEVGTTIIAALSAPSAVRVRVRRSSNLDDKYDGTVYDTITYADLYGQIQDNTPQYGELTTVHTKRKATPQATSIKQPQLKVLCTELVYKYLGGGLFDSVMTANNQAAQSLIRLARDPLVGNVNMSNDSMDRLLSIQAEIEDYFQSELSGQFCYTFDEAKTTAQEIFQTIARAVFSNTYRDGNDIRLFFEKPSQGPAMVFTHRSKVGDEKWTRTFGSSAKDSVEFSYIDPETNIRETIYIPDEGGINPNKIESKGVRNYKQAYWLAHRARQRDILQRLTVEFTATEEGIYVNSGEAISVVKGARVASFDGYIVAQDGLILTLSQEVEFTEGDDHFIQLKKRDGSVEVIRVLQGAGKRQVQLLTQPVEPIYTQNSALKTEFSFGNEARHEAQMIVPSIIDPQQNKTVKITGSNYHKDLFLYDTINPLNRAFSNGFDNGFS